MQLSLTNLLVVALAAAGAPLVVGYLPRLRVPAVVLEIVAGIVLGPDGLGWVEADEVVEVLALLGLAFLLFLAGLEVDVHRLRGRVLRLAATGYAATLVLGFVVGLGFAALGWVADPLFLTVVLSATSLGLVVAVLKDAGEIGSDLGQTVVAGASVSDFAAIVLLSLFFSMSGGGAGATLLLVSCFAVLVALTAVAVSRAGRSMRLGSVLLRLQDTTAEIRVRLAVVLLVGLAALAEHLGLEAILGTFLAGALVSVADRDTATHPHLRTKLEAIGFGFLVPVFFVASGVRLDLDALLSAPSALLRVPLFLAALLVVRGLPALLYRPVVGRAGVPVAALLQGTSLPFIVAAVQIGVGVGVVSTGTGAALVCAGLLSVVVFPPLALARLRGSWQPTGRP